MSDEFTIDAESLAALRAAEAEDEADQAEDRPRGLTDLQKVRKACQLLESVKNGEWARIMGQKEMLEDVLGKLNASLWAYGG